MHVLHLHFGPYQLLISVLNCVSVVVVLKWSGRVFQILGASDLNDCFPYFVVLTCVISAVLWYLNVYDFSVMFIRSCRYVGVCLLLILKTSIAKLRRRLILREGNFERANIVRMCFHGRHR